MPVTAAKRLLFIAHRVPFPPDKGDRIRSFHQLQALSSHFRITVLAFAHSASERQAGAGLGPLCQQVYLLPGGHMGLLRGALSLLSGKSVTQGYFGAAKAAGELARLAGDGPFDLALGCCSSMLPLLEMAPAAAKVMDLVDADSAKWAAYAATSAWPWSWLYHREAAAVRRLEEQAIRHCQAVLLVSQAEKRQLGDGGDGVLAVGNGVDLEYFKPPRHAADGATVVFTGTMDYRPNIEGVCWFARDVWPAVRQAVPAAAFKIVGRNPPPAVRRLARCPGVVVTGAVPDVRPYLHEACAAVVPLALARGVQNKVLEAMACGLPVIGSPPALEGLNLAVGSEVLMADSPREWVHWIDKLLKDGSLRRELGLKARAAAEQRYSWAAQMAPLVSLCQELAERPQCAGVSQ